MWCLVLRVLQSQLESLRVEHEEEVGLLRARVAELEHFGSLARSQQKLVNTLQDELKSLREEADHVRALCSPSVDVASLPR